MQYASLFIKTVILQPSSQQGRVNANIPLLKNVDGSASVIAIDAVPCDSEGQNLDFEKAARISFEQFLANGKNISLVSDPKRDIFYRLVPVVKDNGETIRIQCEPEDDKKNVVEIKRKQTVISYQFTPYFDNKRRFKREVHPATLQIQTIGLVPKGTIGYVIGEIFYPLPEFNNSFFYQFEGQLTALNLQLSGNEASKSFVIKQVAF